MAIYDPNSNQHSDGRDSETSFHPAKNKQLTPVQRAIEYCDKQINACVQLMQPIPTDYITWKLFYKTKTSFEQSKQYLQSLLPEEKAFAEKAFNKGIDFYGSNPNLMWVSGDFEDYYKKYEP